MQEVDVDVGISEAQVQLTKYDYSSSAHVKFNGTSNSSFNLSSRSIFVVDTFW